MSKRDYKTYNVLGEELAQEGIHGNNKCTEAQEVAIQSTNEDENKVSDIGQVCELATSQEEEGLVEVAKIRKEQKSLEKEATLQFKKKINIGKKLTKSKEEERKIHQSSVEVNPELDGISHINHEASDLSKTMSVNENIDKNKDVNKKVSKNTDKNIGISNNIHKGKSIDTSETQEEVDMTFSGYKNYYQTKERSKLVKWSLRLAKLILIIMLLPLIATVAGTVALFIGGFLTAIVIPIGVGIAILGAICFMSTQVHASLIALGISASVTALALGGILLILFCMLMKWIIGLFKKYKKPRNQRMKKEER